MLFFYVMMSRGLIGLLFFFSFNLQAMDLVLQEDSGQGQKRTRQVFEEDEVLNKNESPLKKIKISLNPYFSPSPNPLFFFPNDYPIQDIWERIGSFLELMNFQSLRCVCHQTNQALKQGVGLFYKYNFDRPPEYLINLMNFYPALQVELTLSGKHPNCTANLDFVLDILREYNLSLMSQLPDNGIPKNRVIYVEKEFHHLKYTLLDPSGNVVNDSLPITTDEELTLDVLCNLKSELLVETTKRAHTFPTQKAIRNRIRELNLHSDIINNKIYEIVNFLNEIKTNIFGLENIMIEAWHERYNTILEAFFESLAFQNLKSLCLAVNFMNINKDRSKCLFEAVARSQNLTHLSFGLDLSHSKDDKLYFDTYFFEEFPLALSKNKSLKTLSFRGCHFELEQVPYLLKMMEMANPTLTTLILDDNLFGLEGMSLILEKNIDLKTKLGKGLSCLSLNNISSAGRLEDDFIFYSFLEAIKNDSLLTTLTLGGGIFLDVFREFVYFPQMLQAFSKNKSLQKLCLHSLRFKEIDKKSILLFFQKNQILNRLELFSCFSEGESPDFFIECLYHNTSLLELVFDEPTRDMFGNEKMEMIDQILYRNLLISMRPELQDLMCLDEHYGEAD